MALNVGDPEGRAAFDALLAGADVFVTNLRPVVLEGWGLAPDALLERFPRLVVATLTGFGEAGARCATGRATTSAATGPARARPPPTR